jgi:hypothetical protein
MLYGTFVFAQVAQASVLDPRDMDEHIPPAGAVRRGEPVILGRINHLKSRLACFVSPSSPADCSLNRTLRPSQAEPGLAASVLLDITHAASQTWSGRRTVRSLNRPYVQDPPLNAGITATSVVRSQKATRLS